MENLKPEDNKFHQGNGEDGKHYWLTPPDMMEALQKEFGFDFDACPFPLPDGYNSLSEEWGISTYVNPPFGSVMILGRKKGPTAWARKALEENAKGKRVVLVYPIDKWVLMLLGGGCGSTQPGRRTVVRNRRRIAGQRDGQAYRNVHFASGRHQ